MQIVPQALSVNDPQAKLPVFKIPDGAGNFRNADREEAVALVQRDWIAAFVFDGMNVGPTDPKVGFVYFAQSQESNLIKIGFTTGEPQKRLISLQVGSAARLSLLAFCRGTLATEGEYHRKFAALKKAGEWFSPSPALMGEIARLQELS